jgi:hypothetical protein
MSYTRQTKTTNSSSKNLKIDKISFQQPTKNWNSWAKRKEISKIKYPNSRGSAKKASQSISNSARPSTTPPTRTRT